MKRSVQAGAEREAADWLRADPNRVRGEFVLIVSGATDAPPPAWEKVMVPLLAALPLAQAVRLMCDITGARRKVVYEAALARTGASPGED